jgi:transcription initiation factor TFIIIB Brf1 subunit/transcription initiation factor TFIIB
MNLTDDISSNEYFNYKSNKSKKSKQEEFDSSCGTYLSDSDDDVEKCFHTNIIENDGQNICEECGIMIDEVSCDKDWRYYGSSDNRMSKDPTRCYKKKNDMRSIYKDVEGMSFSESIINNANKKYRSLVKDKIYRGNNRKALIVNCIFYSYKDQGEEVPIMDIARKFNIKKKTISEGMKLYTMNFSTDKHYTLPKDLIIPILNKVNIDMKYLTEIKKLCDSLHNKSDLLNRSNPNSVASAIVYLYICMNPEYKKKLGLTKNKFADAVELSDITITKLVNDASKIINANVKL